MNDSLLGIRLPKVTNSRACTVATVGRDATANITVVTPSVRPYIEYPVAVVVVGLKIVYDEILSHRKAPDSALTERRIGIKLIDSPVVGLVEFNTFRRSIGIRILTASVYARSRRIRILYSVSVGAEVHIMLGRIFAGRPAKSCRLVDVRCRAISRFWLPGKCGVASHNVWYLGSGHPLLVDADVVNNPVERSITCSFRLIADRHFRRAAGAECASLVKATNLNTILVYAHHSAVPGRHHVYPLIKLYSASVIIGFKLVGGPVRLQAKP